MSDKIQIVRATQESASLVKAAFLALLVALSSFEHDAKPTEANVAIYWDEVFAPALEAGKDCLFLAVMDGRAVGGLFWVAYGGSLELAETTALDHGCWVDPAYRRRGVATRLRQAGIALLREQGVTAITSSISPLNKPGLRSYEKFNPEVIGFITKVRI